MLELTTRLAFPHDSRTLQNDFPRFQNLGNTCYLDAVLQCIFHCEPLGADLSNSPDVSVIIERAARAVFVSYVASDVSAADVIAPTIVVGELRRHVGFTFEGQQDAGECLGLHIGVCRESQRRARPHLRKTLLTR